MNYNDESASIRSVAQSALSGGERLYWVGHPNPMRLARRNLMRPLFGLFWMAMIYFMFTQVRSFGSGLRSPFSFSSSSSFSNFAMIFQLMLAVFFLIGLSMIFSPLWNYLKARFTVYALTDERAMIINRLPTQTVHSYSTRNIEKVERRGSEFEGDVIFGSETRTYTNHNRRNQGGIHINFSEGGTNVNFGGARTRTVTIPIGFFGITQPREVENLLLDMIQRNESER